MKTFKVLEEIVPPFPFAIEAVKKRVDGATVYYDRHWDRPIPRETLIRLDPSNGHVQDWVRRGIVAEVPRNVERPKPIQHNPIRVGAK